MQRVDQDHSSQIPKRPFQDIEFRPLSRDEIDDRQEFVTTNAPNLNRHKVTKTPRTPRISKLFSFLRAFVPSCLRGFVSNRLTYLSSYKKSSPLGVEGVDLGLKAKEIVACVADGRRPSEANCSSRSPSSGNGRVGGHLSISENA